MLALGARVLEPQLALEIVDVWLKTEFAGDRHQRRLDKITGIEDTCAVEHAQELANIVQEQKN